MKKSSARILNYSKILSLLIIGLISFIIIVQKPQNFITGSSQVTINQKIYKKANCRHFGETSLDPYLYSYIVKKGDTLFSIAAKELGDVSRTQEIINFNQRTYPKLSIDKPFIEIGMQFTLPQKPFISPSGYLRAMDGVVTGKNDNDLFIVINPDWGFEIQTTNYHLTSSTVLPENKSILVNDCVKVLVKDASGKLLSITHQ